MRYTWTSTLITLCAVTLASAGCAQNADSSAETAKATVPAAPTGERPAPARQDVNPDEFERLWKQNKYAILDVRTEQEFKAGHIPGAINIDVNSPDFEKKLAEYPKDKPYLIHCRSGARSVKACDMMAKVGYEKMYNLEGGIVAWEKAGKAVEK